MTKFINPLKQHRYFVPTQCTHIAAEVDPARTWPVPECGEPVWGASSFCEHHHRRVYRAAKPLRVQEFVQELSAVDHDAAPERADHSLKELA